MVRLHRVIAAIVLVGFGSSGCAGTAPARGPTERPLPAATAAGSTTAMDAPGKPSPPAAASRRAITEMKADELPMLAKMAMTRGFTAGRAQGPRLLSDGSAVVYLRPGGAMKPEQGLYILDFKTGETREVITPEQVLKGADEQLSAEEKARRERMRQNRVRGIAAFQLASDDRRVLLSLSGRVFVVGLDGKVVVEVAGADDQGQTPIDARFSPDGKHVAFVRGGALWVVAASGGKARQVTSGSKGTVVQAQAEYIAQEELDRFRGYWWSPDSKWLAFQEYDEARVQTLVPQDPANPFAEAPPRRYPRPGTPNVDSSVGIVAATGGKVTWLTWDRNKWEYLVNVIWDEGGPLSVLLLSRDQRDAALLAADVRTGKTTTLVAEHDDAWVAPSSPEWLADGSGFLWRSEAGGWAQLELRAPDGSLVRTLTPPELGFRSVLYVDRSAGSVIVAGAAEPVDAEVYEVPLAGGAPKLISEVGVVTRLSFATGARVAMRTRFTERQDFRDDVIRGDGSVVASLPEPFERAPADPAPIVRKVGDGRGLWTSTIRPTDFDPTQKYPVVVQVYGGPGVLVVSRNRNAYRSQKWLADHGVFVVQVDGRGTPGRGRDWERAIKGKFAEVPLEDQVTGLLALAKLEPAMDMSRVAISGWSFGGYMAALAVMRRPDIYRAGIAGAPVADWLDYDTCYTERYLGVPELGKDTTVYEQNGLLAYAKDLTRPLLIIHGTADDNVHFSNALELGDALFLAGRPFELVPLAGETHSPRRPEHLGRQLEKTLTFLRANL
jgi:dipeptidyl-peptidase-4